MRDGPNRTLFFLICIFIGWNCNTITENHSLTIGVIGDQFGAYDAEKAYKVMSEAVEKLSKHNPDIILHVGDIVESVRNINSYSDYEANFQKAVSIMNRFDKPWLVAIGDHDVAPPEFKALSEDRSREKWFLDLCQQTQLPITDNPYYSYDYKGYHFISLYSLENLHTDPRWGSIFLNEISDQQLEWLKDDLDQHKNSTGIVVLVHHPHWYVWSNWYRIHKLLRQYPVVCVIAGHYHYDQDDGIIDGIRYIVIGATGGVVKNCDGHSGGVHQYGVIELNGKKLKKIQLYEVYSDSVLELTPRRSMDRIQAISCMLDNLLHDESLVIEEGKLYTRLSSGTITETSQIGLESLANPIDVPITIHVMADTIILKNPKWSTGTGISDGTKPITLNPGERIGWANYSNVGQWYEPSALWQAKIISSDKNFRQVTLTVLVKFCDTRQRFMRRSITYAVNYKGD